MLVCCRRMLEKEHVGVTKTVAKAEKTLAVMQTETQVGCHGDMQVLHLFSFANQDSTSLLLFADAENVVGNRQGSAAAHEQGAGNR